MKKKKKKIGKLDNGKKKDDDVSDVYRHLVLIKTFDSNFNPCYFNRIW